MHIHLIQLKSNLDIKLLHFLMMKELKYRKKYGANTEYLTKNLSKDKTLFCKNLFHFIIGQNLSQ